MHTDLREKLHKARTLEDMAAVLAECEARAARAASAAEETEGAGGAARARRDVFCCEPGDAYTSWYRRHSWEAQRLARKHELQQAQQQLRGGQLQQRSRSILGQNHAKFI